MYKIKKSLKLFEEAKLHMPGGVNSPVRAFKNIDGHPIFFIKAKGPYVFDADDNKITLNELADKYSVSAERIRQIEATAFKKLKTALVHV